MERDELILVCEALRLHFGGDSLALLRKLGTDTAGFAEISDAPADVEAPGFRFSANAQLLEPILVERLGERGLNVFDLLLHAHGRLSSERSAAWVAAAPEVAAFVEEALEVVRNYLGLAVSTPELFEGAVLDVGTRLFASAPPVPVEGCEKVRRLLQLAAMLGDGAVVDGAVETLEGDGVRTPFLMSYFLGQELRRHTVCSPELEDLVGLCRLLLGNGPFRRFVLENCDTRKLSKGVEVETHTFLGALLSQSLLPHARDPRLPEFEKRVYERVAACKTQNAYNKTVEVS